MDLAAHNVFGLSMSDIPCRPTFLIVKHMVEDVDLTLSVASKHLSEVSGESLV